MLYSRIAIALWKSSQGIERHIQMQNTPSSFTAAGNSSNANNGANQKNAVKSEKRPVGATESQVNFSNEYPRPLRCECNENTPPPINYEINNIPLSATRRIN